MNRPPPMPSSPPPLPSGDASIGGSVDEARKDSKVRIWIAINLGAFPGLGTLLAGRKEGYIQSIWMVAGFVAFVLGMYRWARFKVDVAMGTGTAEQAPGLGWVWWGLGSVVFAWGWAGWSSWLMWKEVQAARNSPR